MSSNRYTEEFKNEAVRQVIDRGYNTTLIRGGGILLSPSANLIDCIEGVNVFGNEPDNINSW